MRQGSTGQVTCCQGLTRRTHTRCTASAPCRFYLGDPDQEEVPIGAHGVAAIRTGGGGFAVLRKFAIRAHA
jgi:hypothetical protein